MYATYSKIFLKHHFLYTNIASNHIRYNINAQLMNTIFMPVYRFIVVSLARSFDLVANKLLDEIWTDYELYLLRLRFF